MMMLSFRHHVLSCTEVSFDLSWCISFKATLLGVFVGVIVAKSFIGWFVRDAILERVAFRWSRVRIRCQGSSLVW